MISGLCTQENAGQRTPQGPGSLVQQLREQVLERVQLETDMMRARNQPVEDVGPFYGLPSKVKQLFDTQRGIKTLYGKNNLSAFANLNKLNFKCRGLFLQEHLFIRAPTLKNMGAP